MEWLPLVGYGALYNTWQPYEGVRGVSSVDSNSWARKNVYRLVRQCNIIAGSNELQEGMERGHERSER